MATDRLMTYAEAADYLNVTYDTVRRWAADGRLTKIKYGNLNGSRVRVRKSELDRLIKASTVKA